MTPYAPVSMFISDLPVMVYLIGPNNLLLIINFSFKFFANFEEGQFLRGHRYILPRLWIPAGIGRIISYYKTTETPDLYPAALFQFVSKTFKDQIDDINGFLLRQVLFCTQGLNESRLVHTSSFFRFISQQFLVNELSTWRISK